MVKTTTPTPGSITTTEVALRTILAEVTPGIRPYSSESYLPDHLVKAAQAALDGNSLAARQHAHNALSTAAWHIARGEAPQALARMRRAQSHILASMEGGAA
jgi:DNA-binding NarL/FixJ family response regulator